MPLLRRKKIYRPNNSIQAIDTARKNADRKQARIVKTVHPSPAIIKRRLELEADIMLWLPWHFPNVFYSKFGKVHYRLGARLQDCIENGGRFAFSMSRASGKSAFGKPAIPYCSLSGKSPFPVALGASTRLTESYYDFVKISFMTNPQLKENYPEVCCFFAATDGKAIRAHNQLFEDGTSTGLKFKDDHITLPMVRDKNGELYPSAGSTIFFRSMDSKIRGITETTQDGSIIRPTIVLPDDIQDDQVAASDVLSEKYEKKMMSSVLGLGGPHTKLACFMPGTVQRRGDFFSRFLDRKLHPDFRGENVPMIIKWPDALDTLWKTYGEMWREDLEEEKGFDRCYQFLKDNWDAMHDGAEVSWNERIRYNDNGDALELSALHTAINIWLEIGDSFFAEYQGEPLDHASNQYNITIGDILNHMTDLPPYELPENSDIFVGHADINRSGLHWCLQGFKNNMTAHIPMYGKTPSRGDLWPENASQQVKERGIFDGLKSLCDQIEKMPFVMDGKHTMISLLMVDRGFEHTIVDQFCEQAKYSFNVVPNFGQPADKFRPSKAKAIGRIMDNVYYGKFQTGKAIAHNSDFWRETYQRSFLTEPGNAGGTTIFKAPSLKAHTKFAEHTVGERLLDKYDDKTGLHYKWSKHTKNTDVDWLDAGVGCWAAAGYSGLSPSGMIKKPKTKQASRVVIGRPSQRR